MDNEFARFVDAGADGVNSETGRMRITVTPRADVSPAVRDLMAKTLVGEAADQPDEGQAAVAHVIMNRVGSGKFGKDVPNVVLAPNQFEPWQTRRGELERLDRNSPAYQRAAKIVDGVLSGEIADPTGGAMYFLQPDIVMKRSGRLPNWAQGEGQRIGDHVFFGGAPASLTSAEQQPTENEFAKFVGQKASGDPATPRPAARIAEGHTDAGFASPHAGTPAFEQGRDAVLALREGLNRKARQMTTGPETAPGQRLALDFANQGSAAAQGTTPDVETQYKNIVSADVFQNDAGEILYRDASGQVVPTDQNKQVVLRDPADNRLKVFQRTPDTNEGRVSAAGRILMTGMAAGAPTARPAVPVMKAAAPSREALRGAADKGFDAFRASGAEVPGAAVKGVSQEITSSLNADGMLDMLAPKTHGVLARLEAAPDGSVVTAQQLHGIRRALGNAAKSQDPTEKAAAAIAMSRFDEFLGSIPETKGTLDDAISNYAAAKRSERIGTIAEKAKGQAAATGAGANIDNAIRQQVKSILNDPKKLRGFSPGEIAQMKQIVQGNLPRNAARLLGKLAPTGIVSAGISGGAGAAAGGPAGAAGVMALGYVSKKLADAMTASQLAKLDEVVRSRSPLGKSIGSSMEDWSKAAKAMSENPSAPRLAAFQLASRNFANNLHDVGINMSPADFLRSLQGPMKSAADEKQD